MRFFAALLLPVAASAFFVQLRLGQRVRQITLGGPKLDLMVPDMLPPYRPPDGIDAPEKEPDLMEVTFARLLAPRHQ